MHGYMEHVSAFDQNALSVFTCLFLLFCFSVFYFLRLFPLRVSVSNLGCEPGYVERKQPTHQCTG